MSRFLILCKHESESDRNKKWLLELRYATSKANIIAWASAVKIDEWLGSCYKQDIVHGEIHSFKFDILRDSYSQSGTLGDRKCAIAIVDEVDSMLLDDSSNIARLSSIVPGMNHFQAVYVLIWQHLILVKDRFMMFHNKLYFVSGKVGFEDGKIILQIADDNNDIVKIPDLEYYFRHARDISLVGEAVGDDIDCFLSKSLERYVDDQIGNNKFYIPSNLADFPEKQKSKCITIAIEALDYQENVHYVVCDGEIKHVDYSTGIVQSSTNWSDGLHQFLQLKHNLKMTSETPYTNFFVEYWLQKRIPTAVVGLTGTLGSETARPVLEEVYKVELINIPKRRQKQYLELDPVVVHGETNWLKEVTSSILVEI